MLVKRILMIAAAVLVIGMVIAEAQPAPRGNDPYGYYSQYDQNGYYDRDGRYRRIRERDRGFDGPLPPPPAAYGPPPPSGGYYEQGRMKRNAAVAIPRPAPSSAPWRAA
jgi:hypothetical protein